MILPAVPIKHRCGSFGRVSQPLVGIAIPLSNNGCVSKTTRVLSATFADAAFFRHKHFP
jgi:hypothetical protein